MFLWILNSLFDSVLQADIPFVIVAIFEEG